MKQIIPFQKELLFKTKVSEITSISLEHTLSLTSEDLVSGEFHISGDYKMTDGSINREKFDFTLPFEITLTDKYQEDSLVIDIDNFYYEIVNNESLKVNIDIYIEGNKEEIINETKKDDTLDKEEREELKEEQIENIPIPNPPEVIINREDELEEEIKYQKGNKQYLEEDNNDNINFNIFENIDNSDTYVTYHVYIVKENDNIDKIMEKFNVTKEAITQYNNIEDIKPGTKLIIPNSNE